LFGFFLSNRGLIPEAGETSFALHCGGFANHNLVKNVASGLAPDGMEQAKQASHSHCGGFANRNLVKNVASGPAPDGMEQAKQASHSHCGGFANHNLVKNVASGLAPDGMECRTCSASSLLTAV